MLGSLIRCKAQGTTMISEKDFDLSYVESSNEKNTKGGNRKKPKKSGIHKRRSLKLDFKKNLVVIFKEDFAEDSQFTLDDEALIVVNQIMMFIFKKITYEAKKLMMIGSQKTLNERVIATATKLALSETMDLQTLAVESGQKAVRNHQAYFDM